MKLLSLLLAAYTASPDAGVDAGGPKFTVAVYDSCPAAPPVEVLDGGWVLMPPARSARLACIVATCEARQAQLRERTENAPPPPPWLAWVAGLLIAGTAGYTVGRYAR